MTQSERPRGTFFRSRPIGWVPSPYRRRFGHAAASFGGRFGRDAVLELDPS